MTWTVAARLATLAALSCTTACTRESDALAEPPVEATSCRPGQWRSADGVCITAGLPPDMPCPPGEWLRPEDGACIPAGVPPDGCGEGFVHDGDRGCEPTLPSEPCPVGLMAVPGERECHEVAPCGTHKWGDIPIEPDTEFVDGSYAGDDSDGSAERPWTAIQDGIGTAAPGAIVAVARGSYDEDVIIEDKAVRLWGRCASLVEIVGSASGYGAIVIVTGATGTEVRGLALTGERMGLVLSGSEDVLVESAWVHDNVGRGINAENTLGPTSVMVRASLIEHNHECGVRAAGCPATVDTSVVRATLPGAAPGTAGLMISVPCSGGVCDPSAPAHADVKRSVVEQSHDTGVRLAGSTGSLDSTVVRGTLPDPAGLHGRGLSIHACNAFFGCNLVARSSADVHRSLVVDNRETGVLVDGSDVSLDATVVRGTQPGIDGYGGHGVNVQVPCTLDGCEASERASATLRASLIEKNHEVGVRIAGSDLVLEATVVRGTLATADGLFGSGVAIQVPCSGGFCDGAARANGVVRASLVEDHHDVGLLVSGSDAELESTIVRNIAPRGDGLFGRGVGIQQCGVDAGCSPAAHAFATLRGLLVEQTHEVGIYVGGSDALIEASVVSATKPNGQDLFGDGIVVVSADLPATAVVTSTRIEESSRGALAAFGASASYRGNELRCQSFDVIGESYPDLPYVIDNGGNNGCGCPDATASCIVESAGFEAPPVFEFSPPSP